MKTMTDLIVELTKLDIPQKDGEYICLGHYDMARITCVNNDKRDDTFRSFKQARVNNTFEPESVEQAHETDPLAPESVQRNYLISSGKYYGDGPQETPFTFLMTISVKHNDPRKQTLSHYVAAFIDRLKANRDDTNSFYWRFYYPVARGDIIVLLSSNSFADATYVLYKFVDGNEDILYSYTIPMIKRDWLTDHEEQPSSYDLPSIRLRATVKDYQELYKDIKNIDVLNRDNIILASFGTDDIQMDFSKYSNEKLRSYLSWAISGDGQARLRDIDVFSAELDVPRIIDMSSPMWKPSFLEDPSVITNQEEEN